jgi:Tol biopolymer transport system component
MKFFRLSCTIVLLVFAGSAWGQYFGQNKVRYRDFKFSILHTEHFDIYYYPAESRVVTTSALMLERWHARFENIFHFSLHDQPVVIYQDHPDFEQTNVIAGLIPQEVGGVTEALDRRIVVALTGVMTDDDHVLGHELVHAFQFALIKKIRMQAAFSISLPTWFIEGMAEYLSLGNQHPLTAMWMRDAVVADNVPKLSDAEDEVRYFPYRYGHAIWAYIAGSYGDSVITPLFTQILLKGWRDGFPKTLGTGFDSLSAGWQRILRDTYSQQTRGRYSGSQTGISLASGRGDYNLSPSLSPDGRYIAYLSLRDIFSFDLFLADAATGKIVTKLSSSKLNKVESIAYINAAGAWSADGRQFVFPVVKSGRNAIGVFDINSRKMKRAIDIPQVDAIIHLSWSPDGQRIAFFGIEEGIGHLFVYTLATGAIEQITDGTATDMQPAWSPDGKAIAFATNRGSGSSPDSLIFGPTGIGILDFDSRQITTFAISAKASHLNPQYSPDGGSIYFMADPDGISDVFRYDIGADRFYRITRVSTGISGLTSLSPALTVAKDSGTIAVSVFENGNYDIYKLPDSAREGVPYQPADSLLFDRYASLPPGGRDMIVGRYLNDSAYGLADWSTFISSAYKPRLNLTYAGELFGGLTADNFGVGVAGGAFFLFSDVLGDHLLGAALQINGGLADIGTQIQYLNQSRRLNWGGSVSHIPYYYTSIAFGTDTVDTGQQSTLVNTKSVIYERIFDDDLLLLGQLPLTTFTRIDGSIGFTRYSYSVRQETQVYSIDGRALSRTTSRPMPPPGLNLLSAALAYVGDYSHFGFNGPVSGRRYHAEVNPTIGSLTFIATTLDYRYYYFLKPMTFAARGMHIGRYMQDADNNQLSILYLGYPTWVRGYGIESFNFSRCGQSANDDCDKFDRITGSSAAVANLEFRLPVLGTQRLGLIDFKYLPTDFIIFGDGGVAWTKKERPKIAFANNLNSRVPVFSTGAALRFNLFGFFVLQVYCVYPFQRPGKGAFFDFEIAPAW